MSASARDHELLDEILALAARYGLSRFRAIPACIKITYPDGREQVEPIPPGAIAPAPVATPAQPAQPDGWPSGPEPKHTADFRRVYWPGLGEFRLGPKQAAVVAALWDALEDEEGDGSRTQADLLAIAESDGGRLRDLFTRSPAWGTLIVGGGTGGSYRLPLAPREEIDQP